MLSDILNGCKRESKEWISHHRGHRLHLGLDLVTIVMNGTEVVAVEPGWDIT